VSRCCNMPAAVLPSATDWKLPSAGVVRCCRARGKPQHSLSSQRQLSFTVCSNQQCVRDVSHTAHVSKTHQNPEGVLSVASGQTRACSRTSFQTRWEFLGLLDFSFSDSKAFFPSCQARQADVHWAASIFGLPIQQPDVSQDGPPSYGPPGMPPAQACFVLASLAYGVAKLSL